jgi:hypothetical protein
MAKADKRQAQKEDKQLKETKIGRAEEPAHIKGVSPSGLSVANYLSRALGEKEARKIAAGMTDAAKTKSMRKRLGRIQVCVESVSESDEETAA